MKTKIQLMLPARAKIILAIIGIALITFVAFLPSLNNGFLEWDDTVYLTKNPHILRLDSESLQALWMARVEQIYVPLTELSFAVEYHFGGLNPFIYHLDNLILHISNVLLIFWFVLRCRFSIAIAAITAVCFAIHPMHAESVAWVSERKDLLYSLFYILALHEYWRFCHRKSLSAYILTIIFGILSMLAKPMAISLLLIFFLLDWWWKRPLNKKLFLEKLPHLLYIIPIAWITYSLHARIPFKNAQEAILIWIWSFVFYLKKFFLPWPLLVLYPTPKPISVWNPAYSSSILFSLILALCLWRFRKNRLFLFAFLYYFFSIFFLLRYDTQKELVLVADHYMYLPSLGLCLFLGFYVYQFFLKSNPRAIILGSFLLIAMSFLTFERTKIWGSEYAMWTEVLRYYPSSVAHDSLGLYYINHGQYDLAVSHLDQALTIYPQDTVRSLNNRGLAYIHQEKYQKAIADLNRALELNPQYTLAYFNRGVAYDKLGQYEPALEDYTSALRLNPDYMKVYYNRGLVFLHLGQIDFALKDISKSIEINPKFTSGYLTRAQIYRYLKKFNLAFQDLNESLKIDPSYAPAYNQRGLLYESQQQHSLAQRDFKEALRINPTYAEARNNLNNL